jgi:hypothetical protein
MDRLVTRTTLDKVFIWYLTASPVPCVLSSIEFCSTTESSICLSSDGSKVISSYAESGYSLFEDYFAVWNMESRDREHELLSTTSIPAAFKTSSTLRLILWMILLPPRTEAFWFLSGSIMKINPDYGNEENCLDIQTV